MKNNKVSDKIRLLKKEGYPQDQAVAIALDMRDRDKLAKGGEMSDRGKRYNVYFKNTASDLGLVDYYRYEETENTLNKNNAIKLGKRFLSKNYVGRYIPQKYFEFVEIVEVDDLGNEIEKLEKGAEIKNLREYFNKYDNYNYGYYVTENKDKTFQLAITYSGKRGYPREAEIKAMRRQRPNLPKGFEYINTKPEWYDGSTMTMESINEQDEYYDDRGYTDREFHGTAYHRFKKSKPVKKKKTKPYKFLFFVPKQRVLEELIEAGFDRDDIEDVKGEEALLIYNLDKEKAPLTTSIYGVLEIEDAIVLEKVKGNWEQVDINYDILYKKGGEIKRGDKLKIKLKNGKELDVIFQRYSTTDGIAFGRFIDEDGEYETKPFSLDYVVKKYQKGGSVNIVNEGEKFDSDRYGYLLGDIDGDGNLNVDDKYPYDSTKTGYVEASPLSESIIKLIDLKDSLDETMYDTVDKIVEFSPGSDVYARTKTPFSIINKLVKKRLLDANKGLTDLVGTTIAVNDLNELNKVRDKIRNGELGTVLEEENFYVNPKGGYQAIHYILNIDGNQVEVQLKTKRTKEFNELTHEAYKKGQVNEENVNYIMDIINSADKGNEVDILKFDSLMTDKENVKKMITKTMELGGELDKLVNESTYEGTSLPYTFSITNTGTTPTSASISPVSVMAKGGEIEKIRNFKKELNKVVDEKCTGLECDGTSRIIDYIASLNGIETQPKMGAIIKKNGSDIVDGFEPHFWNEIYIDGEKYIIDYRARMWLGESAPHGLFKESEMKKKGWEYIGDNVNFDRKISSLLYVTRVDDQFEDLINEFNNQNK